MGIVTNYLGNYLMKEKAGATSANFNEAFYRSLEMHHQKFELEEFDELLEELYVKEPEIYKEWRNILKKVSYPFVRKHNTLMTVLISDNNSELAVVASDMCKKQMALVSRSIPERATTTSVTNSRKELLLKLEKSLLLMKSEEEDNILRKAEEEFAKYYGSYKDNKYLGDLYNELLDSFETDIYNALVFEINKIDGINEKMMESFNIGLIIDTQAATDKNRNASKCYKFYD